MDRALLEAFLLRCATRKTRRACQGAFGSDISPQAISNLVHELDDEVRSFSDHQLSDRHRFLYPDGLWVMFGRPRKIRKVLPVALGIKADGSCDAGHFQLARSESAACGSGLVGDLKQQGLPGCYLEAIVTEGAGHLLTALDAHYPRVARQRYVFHKVMDMRPFW